jgi:Domain of unknown function (DUF6265)
MKKINFIVVAFAIIFMHSCKKYDANGNEIKEYEELNKATFLLGEWEKKDSLGVLKENWITVDDSTFAGTSYFIINEKDTVHKESMELMQEGDYLIYRTTIKGENKDEPVPFQMMEEKDSSLVFTNPKHEYPSKISYKLNKDKSVLTTISGTIKGKKSSETYAITQVVK